MPIEINETEIRKYFEGKDKNTIPHCIRKNRTFSIKSIGKQSLTVTAGTKLNIIFKYDHLSIVINNFREYDNDKEIREFVENVVNVVNEDVGCRRHLLYAIAREYLERKQKNTPPTFEEINHEFENAVEEAKRRSSEERKARLKRASRKPTSSTSTITVFNRNPDVVADVLERAGGVCEACGNDAPFKRTKDGTPFLEVHHKIRLADNGDDTVENAIALCPNCHRKQHYGITK